jgi:GMP synthase (glutamine-hydrolysing)
MQHLEKILVLDFGSQFTQLIARRIREMGVYSEIIPCSKKAESINHKGIKGIILSGGPASVNDPDAPYFDAAWMELGLPILGICYGFQLISKMYDAGLEQGISREYGHSPLTIQDNTSLFSGFTIGEQINVWMSHGDHVTDLPRGFKTLAGSPGSPIAGMHHEENKIYAIQFHPEVVHTARGKDILSNFVFNICNAKKDWDSGNIIEQSVAEISAKIEPGCNVICGLSGGVDSSVAAVLVNKAVKGNLYCIFVDNGLLRKNEVKQVVDMLGKNGLGLNITAVDAGKRFLTELKGVIDPEQKRKIIGRVFIEVFDEEAKKIKNVTHLVQGTLYPDVIESVSVRGGPSATIKTHHNVGGLPEKMHLKLIEPFRELFKDEVRVLGKDLGIAPEILSRQPFPGPGLAVRILGEVTEERLAILRDSDSIFLEEIRSAGLYEKIWQSFAVLLPVKSVGVMGDGRTYEQTIALRAVYSDDGMTADWCYLPQELLRKVSNRIINEVKGINRVVYDISSKPPSTIEWE